MKGEPQSSIQEVEEMLSVRTRLSCRLISPEQILKASLQVTNNHSQKILRRTISTSPSSLSGKTCLITGASRGIGASIAKRFAAEGVKCILVGRNPSLLEDVKAGLFRRGHQEDGHRVIVGDVGSVEFWNTFKKERNIDILVNAAGITHASPLFVTSPDLLEEVVRTNLIGTIMACKTIGKTMMVKREGKFFSSVNLQP